MIIFNNTRNLTMSKKERIQLQVFYKLDQKEITQKEAAARLNITERWIREKFNRYKKEGDKGLIHKNRGKESKKRWNEEEKNFSLNLLKSDWNGFGPTFTSEKLELMHGIKVSKETLRQIMISEGIWISKKRRPYRQRRMRRHMRGMMVQLDGSPHDWFEGRAPKCTLLVFIDDATSELLWLEFALSESVYSVMRATKNYIQAYGRPHEFYVDFGSTFSVNLNNKERDKKSEWERAMKELGIAVIHAHSPQAKGRVERANGTLQDRLIKEMRLANISSIEEANTFLQKSSFIADHNKKFAVSPAQSGDAHMPVNLFDLENVFCIKQSRILTNDFTITYKKRILQLSKEQKTIIRPKNEIIVRESLSGIINLSIRRTDLVFREINEKFNQIKTKKKDMIQKTKKIHENSRRWAAGLPQSPSLWQSRVKLALPAMEVK